MNAIATRGELNLSQVPDVGSAEPEIVYDMDWNQEQMYWECRERGFETQKLIGIRKPESEEFLVKMWIQARAWQPNIHEFDGSSIDVFLKDGVWQELIVDVFQWDRSILFWSDWIQTNWFAFLCQYQQGGPRDSTGPRANVVISPDRFSFTSYMILGDYRFLSDVNGLHTKELDVEGELGRSIWISNQENGLTVQNKEVAKR
jgi:hypothetical protein